MSISAPCSSRCSWRARCAALCALAPAWHLARLDPLRAIHGTGAFNSRGRFGRALMAGEVALAVVVLLVAGLFYRSFSETRELDPGFHRDGVLLAAYDLGGQARQRRRRPPVRRPAAGRDAGPAGRAGRRDRDLGAARHPRPAATLVRAGGPRAGGRRPRSRAHQHRHAGLLRDDGHSAQSPARTSRHWATRTPRRRSW